MKVFDRHHFAALCRLQLKEISVLDWIAPFFLMAMLLFMINIGVDGPEDWLSGLEDQVMIYFNLSILTVCCEFFARFFKRKNGVCKLSLSGSVLEKWISLWAVILVMLLYWFALSFVADGIMLLIGTQSYELPVSRILEEYRLLYMKPGLAVFYLIMAAGSAFAVTAANTTWGQGKTAFFVITTFVAISVLTILLPETSMIVCLLGAAVVLLIADYFIFKQAIMNTKEMI